MNISEKSMAAIVLCTYIGLKDQAEVKPYTIGEWENFGKMLIDNRLQIENVINDPQILKKCGYSDEEIRRIVLLNGRSVNIALELERYEHCGINVTTVFDKSYPLLLRRKLGLKAPAVFLYAGNIELACKVGLGIVGSRNIDDNIIDFEKKLIEKVVSEKMVIISGGAKGVDSIAEQTALSCGGAVVEYLADSLENKIKRPEIIEAILAGRLLLLTDTKPDLGFSVPRAMNRNKYIYASSYGTFVISSDYNKGGTWNGAVEALRKDYCKVFVWDNLKYEGNAKLICEKGGIPYMLSGTTIKESIEEAKLKSDGSSDDGGEQYVQVTLFD